MSIKLQCYAIRDNKLGIYTTPAQVNDKQTAIRTFALECNNPKLLLSQFPQDFDLYRMGDYDPVTGQFDIIVPELIITGKMAKEMLPTEPVEAKRATSGSGDPQPAENISCGS